MILFSKKLLVLLVVAGINFGSSFAQVAKPFKKDNLVIYRIGDANSGSDINNYNACPIYLDEYNVSGDQPVLVQSVGLPVKTIGENRRIVALGKDVLAGFISRSNDGKYLVVPGYDASPGTDILNKPANEVNRVVALIGADGKINTSSVVENTFNNNSFRSAASFDGTDLWLSGGGGANNGGIFYLKKGEKEGVNLGGLSFRQIKFYNGDLYASEAARIYKIGTGKVTEGGKKFTNLTEESTIKDGTSFVIANLDVTGTSSKQVAYFLTYNNGIVKYSLIKNKWVNNGVFKGAGKGTGIEARVIDGKVKLYVISSGNDRGGDGTLIEVLDNSGYNETISAASKVLLRSGTNQTFRSLSWSPSAK